MSAACENAGFLPALGDHFYEAQGATSVPRLTLASPRALFSGAPFNGETSWSHNFVSHQTQSTVWKTVDIIMPLGIAVNEDGSGCTFSGSKYRQVGCTDWHTALKPTMCELLALPSYVGGLNEIREQRQKQNAQGF